MMADHAYRMDGGDMESGDGLHEDQRWLQELLREAAGLRLQAMGNHRYRRSFASPCMRIRSILRELRRNLETMKPEMISLVT